MAAASGAAATCKSSETTVDAHVHAENLSDEIIPHVGSAEPISIAFIIPMRDREKQLGELLVQLPAFIAKQHGAIDYRIIVVEQTPGEPFNRGLCRNVGVRWLMREDVHFTHLCFHDVDVAPGDGVDYVKSCSIIPAYLIETRILWEPEGCESFTDDVVLSFGLLHDKTLGAPESSPPLKRKAFKDSVKTGVLMCPKEVFCCVNGFSNNFWGWGDEDLDMRHRLNSFLPPGVEVLHFPGTFVSLDYGFHLFTSFGHRWSRLKGGQTAIAVDGTVEKFNYYAVAQFLNQDYGCNIQTYRAQCKRRECLGSDVDAGDGVYALDWEGIHLKEIGSERNIHHLQFDPKAVCDFGGSGLVTGTLLTSSYDIYYINLESRPDRRKRMERMLAGYHLSKYIRVQAVTPEDPYVKKWIEEFPAKRPGQTACAVSHLNLWKRISHHLDEHGIALILEDDVFFHKDWQTELELMLEALRALQDGWDIFFLDCFHMEGFDFSKRGLQGANLCVYADAYLISKHAAARLVALHEDNYESDHEGLLLLLQEQGRCYTTFPKLALQTWEISNIQTDTRVRSIHDWYETVYFKTFPKSLYHMPEPL